MTFPTPWTDDRVETLVRLWRDGRSASQIARSLGGVTRNAVIGKIHRLGVPGRATPTAPGARSAKPKRERRLRIRPPGSGAPPGSAAQRPQPADAVQDPLPQTGQASVVSVRRGQCRWPMGDPLLEGFCLCGRPAVRGAYCGPHGALAYRPTDRDHLLKLAGVR